MRILALWSTLFCLGASALLAQPTPAFIADPIPEGYWLEALPLVVHEGMVGDEDLTGHTTYQLVLHTAQATAYVSSVGGDASNPFELNSTASPAWFNHPLGVNVGAEASIQLPAFFPSYSFDSWLTIGATSATPGYSLSTATGAINPFTAFNAGENVLINDAIGFAIFNLYPGSIQAGHPGFAGDDLSIVLGQITTTGTLSGNFYVQIFPDGTQTEDLRCHFPILSEDPYANPGCTDETACNFNAEATDEDGSCTYPASTFVDCAGNCLEDSDGDGVCDAFEITGCQDVSACDFDASATDEGPCSYPEPGFDCEGNALSEVSYWVQLEPVAAHSGMVGAADLTGQTTYRLVLHTPAPEVFVSAMGGDVSNSFELTSDASPAWFNDDLVGWNLGTDVNTNLFPFIPSAAYDSWLTIGATESSDDYELSMAIGDINPFTAFNAGENVVVDDSIGFALFTTYPGALDYTNPAFAGADHAVTLGQITTAGTLSGWIYLQLFPNGDQSEEIRQRFPILLSSPNGEPGCTDLEACNYEPDASSDDGSCTYPEAEFDCDGNCIADADGDGICDAFEIPGCTDASACNFEAEATDDDGLCEVPAPGFDCDGNDLMAGAPAGYWLEAAPFAQPTGVIDGIDFTGATTYRLILHTPNEASFVSAIGGDATNPFELNSTSIPAWINHPLGADIGADFNPNLLSLAPGAAYDSWLTIGASEQTEGYTMNTAVGLINPFENFNAGVNTVVDDSLGFALFTTYPGALDLSHPAFAGDDFAVTVGQITTTGTLSGWIYFQIFPEGTQTIDLRHRFPILTANPYAGAGCTDSNACNYNPEATDEDGSCTYADEGYDCDGNCLVDTDGDGVCDPFEIEGCQDDTACNYNPEATDEDGSCTYADEGYDCDGNCLVDTDGDGVCDPFEIEGCQDDTACNYNPEATEEDGSCTYADEGYDCDGNCLVDTDGDGVCDPFEIEGCQDDTACNYNPEATDEDGSCEYPAFAYDCDGNCLADTDGDGVCDPLEVPGCMDTDACNYNPEATDENGTCTYPEVEYDCDGNCLVDTDGDGVCDAFEIPGCTDDSACNFSGEATDEDGSCTYPDEGYDCNGTCLEDTDGDGVCDPFEIAGCTDANACNFEPEATDYDGSCTYAEMEYDCDGNCLVDTDGDGVCDPFEVPGCTDEVACNYDSAATDEDGSCSYPDMGFDCNGDPLPCEACYAVFEPVLEDQTLSCAENLPTEPWDVTATGFCTGEALDVTAFVADLTDGVIANSAVTAYGSGPDAAIRINGLAMMGLTPTDLWFEDGALSVTRYSNGTARVTGVVRNNVNPDLAWEVHMVFEGEQPADEFLAESPFHGLITAYGCNPDPAEMSTYLLKGDQSYLQGMDGLAGSFLTLTHMPFTGSKRFQLGEGANGHNCQYGMGGWFSWDGAVLGEDVMGLVGDLVVDLGEDQLVEPAACNQDAVDVIYTAFDPTCNLFWNATQHFEVVDTDAPIFVSGPADVVVSCGEVPEVAGADEFVVEEGCANAQVDLAYLGETSQTGGCGNEFVITRTWQATDCLGNASQYVQTITGVDNTPPTISDLPSDIYFSCDEEVFYLDPTVTDDCGEVTLEHTVEDVAGCGINYDRIITWTATDGCGNASVAIQTLHIEDLTPPVFTNAVAELTAACGELDAVTVEAEDNCGEVALDFTEAYIAGGCLGSAGTVVRTWSASDVCGNTAFFTQTIELTDGIAPTLSITCLPDVVISSGTACSAETSVEALGLPTSEASDNCGAVDVSVTTEDSPATYTCSGYSFVRTYSFTATDACGNASFASCSNTITVEDTTGPSLTLACPADVTIISGADCSADFGTAATGMASATAYDDCEGNVDATVTFEDGPAIALCGTGSYQFERTFTATATDGCGNAAEPVSCTQIITVTDQTPPAFNAFNPIIPVACDEIGDVDDVNYLPLTATDACDESLEYTVSAVLTGGGCPGTYVRTWTATDDCGNTAMVEQYLTLFDDEAPTLAVPETANTAWDATGNWAISVDASTSDNCTATEGIAVTFVDELGAVLCAGDDASPEGSMKIIRTWTAEDFCNNSTQAITVITVDDLTPPTLNAEAVTINCAAYAAANDFGGWSATDNVDSDVAVTWVDAVPSDATGCYTVVRTITAVDDCGNTSEVDQILNVEDTTPPTFTDIPSDQVVACSEQPYAPAAVDDCSAVTIEEQRSVQSSDACGNITELVTLIATDACGNSATAQFTISIYDNVAPEFTSALPADTTVSCDEVPAAATLSAVDNCGGAVEISFAESFEAGNCAGSGTWTRIWTATDCTQNATVHTQIITVEDTTPPVFTSIPADQLNDCIEAPYTATASDACSSVTISEERTVLSEGDCGMYSHLVTLTATDECGNAATATFTITVEDGEPPVFNEELPADVTVACDAIPTSATLTATDACGAVAVTFNEAFEAGECEGEGVLTRTWTATDCLGQSNQHTQTITVEDTTPPVIIAQAEWVMAVEAFVEDSTYATAVDGCSAATLSGDETWTEEGGCTGTIIRTYVAVDACGNTSAPFEQHFILIDTIAPAILAVPEDATYACDEEIPVEYPVVLDNCDHVLDYSYTDVIVDDNPADAAYQIQRSFAITDDCGNTATATTTISIVDEAAPELVFMPAWSVQGPEAWNTDLLAAYQPVVQDVCSPETGGGGSATGALAGTGMPGTWTYELVEGLCTGTFEVEVLYTFVDADGNALELPFTMAFEDVLAPAFASVPADVAISCEAELPTELATGTDLGTASADLMASYSDAFEAGACPNTGTITRTHVLADACGNSASAVQIIELIDTSAPSFTSELPADTVVACGAEVALPELAATDNCGGDVSIAFVADTVMGACDAEMTVTRIWTATDCSNNVADHTQVVSFVDTIAPVFTSVPSGTLTLACGDPVYQIETSDNCSDVSVTESIEVLSADVCGNSTELVTVTATDACGNAAVASFTIERIDTEGPIWTAALPANTSADCAAVEAPATLTATDACGTAAVEFSEATTPGSCAGTYTLTRTWTATDCSGNAIAHTQVIEVTDGTAPAFDQVPESAFGLCAEPVYSYHATDACGTVSYSESRITLSSDDCGNYTDEVTVIASDDCGNTSSITFLIGVEDDEAPVFDGVLPSDMEVACNNITAAATLTATDACTGTTEVTFTETIQAGACEGASEITRTWTTTDCSGNSAVHVQTVTVSDEEAPAIALNGATVEVACEDYDSSIAYASATDNCSTELEWSWLDEATDEGCGAGAFTRTYTAVDACGNVATATQTILLVDQTPPTFAGNFDPITIDCDSSLPTELPEVTDNCGGVVSLTFADEVTESGVVGNYTVERTFTATDACGNTAQATQILEVVDQTPPVFDATPGELILTYEAWLNVNFYDYAPSFSDACDAGATLVVADEIIETTCTGTFTALVTFTASDASGNSAFVTTTATVTDAAAPVITYVPADLALSCDEEVPLEWIVAEDDATAAVDLAYAYTDSLIEGSCDTEYQIQRTFTVTDACGNTSSAEQLITVTDTTAPVIAGTCVAANGETIPLCFDDYDGGFTLPEACELTTSDNCDAGTELVYEEVIVPALAEGMDVTLGYCTVTTPEAVADGLTCDDWLIPAFGLPHSLYLSGLGDSFYGSVSGTVSHLEDNSWVLSQTVVALNNPNAGWTIDVVYAPGMDWGTWMAQPGPQSYRYECGEMVDDHENWEYHLMTSGTLTGWGDYAGSVLNLTHQPSNGYYGMQLGYGANLKNSNFGYSGDFFYTGTFNGSSISGSGDLFGDLDCTQPVTITRTYTATDCAGNSTVFSYAYSAESLACLPNPPVPGPYEPEPDGGGSSGLTTEGTDIRITSLQPNPANESASLSFELGEGGPITVMLFNSSGRLITELFKGWVPESQQQWVQLNTEQWEPGLYTILITSDHERVTENLMVIH